MVQNQQILYKKYFLLIGSKIIALLFYNIDCDNNTRHIG